ncbi:MAG: hypothetical protein HY235_04180 [Acidobacteria bacterium]|nr:hypothetical protein [Acidobacteriota bacterium]
MFADRAVVLFALCAPAAFPQTGIAPAWDIRVTLKNLASQAERYKDIVDQLKVRDWISQGASEGYLRTQQVVLAESGHLKTIGGRLAEEPEKLSLALDAFFRLQTLEALTVSLGEGATRYQDTQLGDELNKLVESNANARASLREYVMDLSVTKEQEYAIAEKEAQRCQAILNRNPLAPPPAKPKAAQKQERK